MKCLACSDNILAHPCWNHNPPPLNPRTTTQNVSNSISSYREHHNLASCTGSTAGDDMLPTDPRQHSQEEPDPEVEKTLVGETSAASPSLHEPPLRISKPAWCLFKPVLKSSFLHCTRTLAKFARFVGPGFLIAVAYIDPGNYSTDLSVGADFKYALLFIILMSNIFAILLQSLCIKLGIVTGLNLAENCREHLPRWLVYILYVFAEAAIVGTDVAEVCT